MLAAPLTAAVLGTSFPAASQNPPACRNYAAASNRSGAGAGAETCDFNTATNQFTCTINLARPARRIVSMRQYASTADFVDEIRVIPAISRAQSGTTHSPGPGAQNSKLTFFYDGQRRQTELAFQFADGRSMKATYSQWDAAGRPTLMTNAGQTLQYRYDDAQRSMTIVNATAGGSQVHTFDADGNLVREDIVSSGGAATTSITVTKTAQVCR